MSSKSDSFIRETADGTLIEIHVQPKASRNELAGVHEGALKVRLTAPPVEGRANKECIKFLAKVLGVPKSGIRIVKGEKSRNKTLLINDRNGEDVLALLREAGAL